MDIINQILIRGTYAGIGILGLFSMISNVLMIESPSINRNLIKIASITPYLLIFSGITGILYGKIIPIIIPNVFGISGIILQSYIIYKFINN